MHRSVAITLLLCLLAACGGAGSPPEGSNQLQVAAAFYPLVFLAERIGGDGVEVTNLTPPGAEPHDLELTPGQVQTLAEADLVVFQGGGFQHSLEDALVDRPATALLDIRATAPDLFDIAGTDDDEGDTQDPHVWLDPEKMSGLAELVGARLADLQPDNGREILSLVADLQAELGTLDTAYEDGLVDCERRSIVTAHEAFAYLAAAYDLEQIGITGVDPESEPSPKRLSEVAEFAQAEGVTTIFFEELLPPDLAETLADELGVVTAKLDPLEGPPPDGDYLSAMRSNLAALREGLGCS